MSVREVSGKQGWLAALIGHRRSQIAALWAEIAGLGPPADMKPGMFRKFLSLLAQITHEREIEQDLITEIEAVELQHRTRRERHLLEKANPAFLPNEADILEDAGQYEAGRHSLLMRLRHWLKPKDE